MKIVAITGIDGGGKSTLIRHMAQSLAQERKRFRILDKWDVVRERFEDCRFLRSCDLEELKVCISEMPLLSRWPFLFWSIAQSGSEISSMQDGDLAILDGYWMKHACAEVVLGYPEHLITDMVATLPKATTTIMLKIRPEISLSRKRGNLTPYECGLDSELSEARFIQHQTAVDQKLSALAAREGWSLVDAEASEETVYAKVMNILQA